jgi:hypothetical protein
VACARLLGVGLAAWWGGCAVVTEDVTHSPRGPGYPGYAIEFVEAVPNPGTPLAAGTRVEFRVTVRYVLQSRERGILQLMFRNGLDADVLPPAAAQPIIRGRWERVTLVHEVEVPSGSPDLFVTVPVLPDGATTSWGMLRLRYPVLTRARQL